jgi:hypothetical protein
MGSILGAQDFEKIMELINTKLAWLVGNEFVYDHVDDTSSNVTEAELYFRSRDNERMLHLDLNSRYVGGSLGIWFDRNTADIEFRRNSDCEIIYQFHNTFQDVEEIMGHVAKALDTLVSE